MIGRVPTEEALEKAKEALIRVKLPEKYWEMSPFELSGGQKRRAAIAGVIAMNPKVLILDEPTAGLDPKGRDELFDLIRELHENMKMTVLLVSHSMEDVANYVESWKPDAGWNAGGSFFPCGRTGTGIAGSATGYVSDEGSEKSRSGCQYFGNHDRGS